MSVKLVENETIGSNSTGECFENLLVTGGILARQSVSTGTKQSKLIKLEIEVLSTACASNSHSASIYPIKIPASASSSANQGDQTYMIETQTPKKTTELNKSVGQESSGANLRRKIKTLQKNKLESGIRRNVH